ncbi:MAG: dihydropteroate synthase [Planctomycetes bacterium]|nr:dihydropteroate synthase [Planctomycetota bacterium]
MAAINATPDSFSDGGELLDPSRAAAAAADAWSAGAAIIDVGGESTRPGAAPVAIAEEIRRVVPVIVKIKQQIPDCYISIDTSRAAVAREAAAAGASMINDISGLRFDAELGRAAAELQLPIVLGHIRGAPATMLQMETYKNVLAEVHGELFAAVARAREAGVRGDAILVDPGLGFAKSAEDNWSILRRLLEIKSLGFPVVVGPSRKRFLGELVDDLHPGGSPRDRDDATLAVAGIAAMRGAAVCRVHDARRALDAVRVGMKFYSNLY